MGWGLRQFSSTSNIWVSRYTCEQAYLRTRLGMIMSACGHEMHGQWSLKWRKSSLKPKMKVSKLYLYIFLVCILGLFINFEYMSLWVYVSLSTCPIYYTNRKYKLCCVQIRILIFIKVACFIVCEPRHYFPRSFFATCFSAHCIFCWFRTNSFFNIVLNI
jgi:hypothetical protein